MQVMHKTFADVPLAEREPYTSRLYTQFRCRCGRTVPEDMMLDVTGVPEELRGQDTHRCDGCWRRWIQEGRITPEGLRDLTGQAPRTNPRKPW